MPIESISIDDDRLDDAAIVVKPVSGEISDLSGDAEHQTDMVEQENSCKNIGA